jgi:hypothetical protein
LGALKRLNAKYPTIFKQQDEGDEQDGDNGNRLYKKYGWVVIDDGLAEGDPLRYSYFDKMNTVSYLNLVAFKMAQNKEAERIRKQQEIKMNMKR